MLMLGGVDAIPARLGGDGSQQDTRRGLGGAPVLVGNLARGGCSRLRPEARTWQPLAQPLFLVIRQEIIRMKNMIIPEGWGEEELVEI